MAKAVLLLYFLIVSSNQMSLHDKGFPSSGNPPKASSSQASVHSTGQVIGAEVVDKDISEDNEVFGSDIDDLDSEDYDIVLGQRIDFQNNAVPNTNKRKSDKSKPGNSPGKPIPRAKRSLVTIDKNSTAKLTSTVHPSFAEPVSVVYNENATLSSDDLLSLDSLTTFESSGDGESFNTSMTEPTYSSLSPRITQDDHVINRTAVDKNSTVITEDDEPSKTVTCEGKSCWEPSIEGVDTENGENEGETQKGQKKSSQSSDSKSGDVNATQSAQLAGNDSIERLKSTRSTTEQTRTSEIVELHKSTEAIEFEELTTTIPKEFKTSTDSETQSASSSNESEGEEIDQSTTEDVTTTPGAPIEDQEVTAPTEASNEKVKRDPGEDDEDITLSTSAPTILSVTEPSTVVTTEPSTVVTTEPSTAVTTEPSTVVTTEPSTVVTTEPSTVVTTEPSTVVTTEPTPLEPPSDTETHTKEPPQTPTITEPLTTELKATELPSTEQQAAEQQVTDQQSVQPKTTEPQVTEPKVTEPQVTEPKTTELQVVTEPTTTEPQVTEPTTEPQVTEPQVTEPTTTEPQVTEPTTTEPQVTEQQVTEPTTTEPQVTEPTTTEPQVTEPTTEPQVTEPQVTELTTTEPQVTELTTTEPQVTEPTTEEPPSTQPLPTKTQPAEPQPDEETKATTETAEVEMATTLQTIQDTTEATVKTTKNSSESTTEETTLTEPDTTIALTVTTAGDDPAVPTSTTVLTTTHPDTTTQPISTTVPPKPSPILNGACSTTDPQGDDLPQVQRCKEIPNADCINGTCQCLARWYQLGDSCQKRYLKDVYQPKLKDEKKSSTGISWPEVPTSPNYDLLEYRVRWRHVTQDSDIQKSRLVNLRKHSGLHRNIRSVSGSQPGDDQNSGFDEDNVQFTNETSAVIEKLTPGTQYLVEVTALVVMSEDGRKEELWYPEISFRLEPNCLKWSEKDATLMPQNKTVIIKFESLEGNYNKCYVKLTAKNLEGGEYSEIDCHTFAVTHFNFGKEYTIETKVTAGETEAKECTTIQTLQKESRIPDPVCTFEVRAPSSESIEVVWEPPCVPHSYIRGYAVTLRSSNVCNLYKFVKMMMADAHETVEADKQDVDIDTKQNQEVAVQNVNDCKTPSELITRPVNGIQSLTIIGLRAGTSYDIKVLAINNKGSGKELTKSITTLSRVPEPPSGFQGEAIGQSAVLLTWTPPTPYPGPTDYVISVLQFVQGDLTDTISTPVVVVTAKGYSSDRIEIKSLREATAYKFVIVANTSLGESEQASTDAIQTWELKSYPVGHLGATDVTHEQVTLNWDTPSQGNGRTRAYAVFVKTIKNTCVQAVAIVNDKTSMGPSQPNGPSLDDALDQSCPPQSADEINAGSEPLYTRVLLNRLEPDTDYIIQVAPYNGAGLGKIEQVKVTTKNAVPNAPASFSCSENSNREEIFIRWSPPKPRPGDTTYILTLAEANDYEGKSFKVLWSKKIEGYINDHLYERDLLDFWQYQAYLTVSTPAGNSSRIQTGVCRTLPAVPGAVPSMSVQYGRQNSSQLEIEWECPKPKDRHGILEDFLLQIIASKASRSDIKLAAISNQQIKVTPTAGESGWPDCSQPYGLTVQILPQVTYVVSIKAKVKTVKDFGPSLERTIYAPGAAPPPFPKLTTVSTTVTKQRPGTFRIRICPTCLLNSAFGQIIRYGLGVCQSSFCNFGSTGNHSLGDYDKLVSWKTSRDAKFKMPYKIFDDSLKKLIVSESTANHDSVEFVVGNQAACVSQPNTNFCNGPLPPGTHFRVFQFSCTTDGCTESDLSEVTATPAAVSTTPSDSIVIGGAASGVAVALIIILIIVIARIRLRKVVEISDMKDVGEDMQLSDITSSHDPVPVRSRPIKIKDLEETLQQLHANNNDLFSQEFTELDMDSTIHPITVGSDPLYRKLNRWSNILPYDHTRVKLKVVDGDEMCSDDYINANFLVGYRTAKDYIATQGPLTATTADFWRMVWEQESSVIVMLSAFQEKDPRSGVLREKVAQYYPDEADNEGSRYDHLLVSWRGKLDNQAWEVRTFHLTHLLERRHRYVKHFFFKSWTDHKADISPQDLISFVNTVREEAESHPPGPIVVHCSAGVGRTGTFIAVDYFCRYIKDLTKGSRLTKISDVMGSLRGSWARRKSMMWEDNTVDIYGRIIALRDCRRYMVQTKSQYAFIYDTVMELVRQASRVDDTSESGNDTESCISVPIPAAGTSATNDVLYDDVDVLKRPDNTR